MTTTNQSTSGLSKGAVEIQLLKSIARHRVPKHTLAIDLAHDVSGLSLTIIANKALYLHLGNGSSNHNVRSDSKMKEKIAKEKRMFLMIALEQSTSSQKTTVKPARMRKSCSDVVHRSHEPTNASESDKKGINETKRASLLIFKSRLVKVKGFHV
jgi:hypothetical protein